MIPPAEDVPSAEAAVIGKRVRKGRSEGGNGERLSEFAAMDVSLQCDRIRPRRCPVCAESTAPRIPIVIRADVCRWIYGRSEIEVFSVSPVIGVLAKLAAITNVRGAALFGSASCGDKSRLG